MEMEMKYWARSKCVRLTWAHSEIPMLVVNLSFPAIARWMRC